MYKHWTPDFSICTQTMAIPEKTTLFRQEQPGGVTYRIPALLYLSDTDTFLAFAEKRSSPLDSHAKYLVMRRGTLRDGAVQWAPMVDLLTACLPGHRTMNPCPVYEKQTKTLFLFFICIWGTTSECRQILTGRNAARLCYIRSTDNGKNWSQLEELTETVIGSKVNKWATFAVGPGHGIQMDCGRLIIPAYVYYIHCKCCCLLPLPCCVKPHALSFYSDDCGETWHVGDFIRGLKSCECEMAEIVDRDGRSSLYCNARNTKGYRVEALSEKRGTEFDRPHLAPKLVEQPHGCQGSVVSFPVPEQLAQRGAGENQESSGLLFTSETHTGLLFSHPTSRKQRMDLGVYLNCSPPHTSGWQSPWIIHTGPSGYSDLAYCKGSESFGCLLECGLKSEVEEIAFVSFPLEDVIGASGHKTSSTLH
ncbi:sialidase-3 isoform X2 [Amia ocellicauda]|uniref:sialidase-3 isoform X2 n=1 Tax=Amia ocellicauda TaxID=2972642 RepID=UPI003464D7F7